MAARKKQIHTEEVKKKIQISQLINRLQNNAMADEEILTSGQIASINILLDRVMPKLKAVDHTGEIDHNVTVTKIQREIVRPKD